SRAGPMQARDTAPRAMLMRMKKASHDQRKGPAIERARSPTTTAAEIAAAVICRGYPPKWCSSSSERTASGRPEASRATGESRALVQGGSMPGGVGSFPHARIRRHMLSQELHLVDEDAAVGEDQELGAVRDVGCVQQLHVRLFGRAAAFLLVARAAGGHHVHPRVAAPARHREDVVAGELERREMAAAERADEAVAVEELAVVERRDLVESLDGERLAADGDDRVGGDAGAFPGALAAAPEDRERLVADLPGHPFLGVIPHRLLPGDPPVRDPVLVEREDE